MKDFNKTYPVVLVCIFVILAASFYLKDKKGADEGVAQPVALETSGAARELSDLLAVADRSVVGIEIRSSERSAALSAEVVNTEQSRSQGLSGREGLLDGNAMLFAFPARGSYNFWMKDMKFPIDIVWIDSLGAVVHVDKSVSPDTYPRSFSAPVEAQFVLETSAGFSDFFEVKAGDVVRVR